MTGLFAAAPVGTSASPDTVRAPQVSAPSESLHTPRILFVEDYPGMRSLVNTMLQPSFEVEGAATYDDALAQAQATSFDLFLIDINLNGEANGLDLLHTLRGHPRHRHTPTIACTAYVSPTERKRILNAGFDAYLSKPFRKERLVSMVWTFLSS